MLLLTIFIVLFLSTALGYYFAGKQGAIGTLLSMLFLFGLPAFIYTIQMA